MIQEINSILQNITAKIQALPAFSGWTISADEYETTPVKQLPVVFVYPQKDIKEDLDEEWDTGIEKRVLTVAVALRTTGFPVSTTVNPLLDAFCNTIKNDQSLAGLAQRVRIHTITWNGENSGDGQIASAAAILEVIYIAR